MRNGNSLLIIILIVAALASSCADTSLKHYNLGLDAQKIGDLDKAIEHWKIALENRKDDADTHFNLGSALMEKGRYEEAEFHLREAAGLAPDDYETQYMLGRILELKGDLSGAKQAYSLSTAIKTNYYPPYIGLASCTLKQEQYRSAEKYATIGLSIAPRDLEGNLILAEAYFKQANYQEAYAQLLSVRPLYGRDYRVLFLLGKVMSERHMHVDAIETLKAAKESGDSSGELFYYLGRSHYALDQYSDAEKYYRLAIYKDKADASSWIGLAQTCFKTGQLEKSLEAWNSARALTPEDPEIDLGIGIVYLNSKRFEEAAALLERLRDRGDSPPRTMYYLGHAKMRLGKKAEAREAFEEFIRTWQGDKALIDEVNEILVTL